MENNNNFSLRSLKERCRFDSGQVCTLDLSNSNLTRLPPSLCAVDAIQVLDLSHNTELKDLPADFSKLKRLRNFSILHSGLQAFPEALVGMAALETLRLSVNNLEEFPPTLAQLTRLSRLDMDLCGLKEIPKCVCTLRNLQFLDLRCNKITSEGVPKEFANLQQLRELNIQSNNLSEFPEVLTSLKKLVLLKLCCNKITNIPRTISKLVNLKEFYFSHNVLSTLCDEISSLSNLTTLVLDHNQLTTLPASLCQLQHIFSKPEGLSVTGNPLDNPPSVVVERGSEAVMAFLKEEWTLQMARKEDDHKTGAENGTIVD